MTLDENDLLEIENIISKHTSRLITRMEAAIHDLTLSVGATLEGNTRSQSPHRKGARITRQIPKNQQVPAVICGGCGQPSTTTNTQYGTRHTCRDCGLHSWNGGQLKSPEDHQETRARYEEQQRDEDDTHSAENAGPGIRGLEDNIPF